MKTDECSVRQNCLGDENDIRGIILAEDFGSGAPKGGSDIVLYVLERNNDLLSACLSVLVRGYH